MPGVISYSQKTTSGDNRNRSSYSTASISPGSNKLILAWVYSIAASLPNTPTASGNGLTWVQIDTQSDADNVRRLTLFRAMGASPSSGALTLSFGGQTQTGAAWSVVEYDGMATTGANGSDAIVQSAKNASPSTTDSLTVTLGAFSDTDNATAAGFGIPLNVSNIPTEGSGFTDTGQSNQNNPNLAIGSEFKDANDTTADMTSTGYNIPWVGIAVEIGIPVATATNPKVWTGSAWEVKPVKVWNGSAWVEKPVKVWNGSAWVEV